MVFANNNRSGKKKNIFIDHHSFHNDVSKKEDVVVNKIVLRNYHCGSLQTI